MIKVKNESFDPKLEPRRYTSDYFWIDAPISVLDPVDEVYLEVLDEVADATFGQGRWANGIADILLEDFGEKHNLPEDLLNIPKDHPLRKEWLEFVAESVEEDDELQAEAYDIAEEVLSDRRLYNGEWV